MNKICYGCGVKLQTTDKEKLGYIPLSKENDAKYCMRCFRMMNYGENKVTNTPKDVKEIIKANSNDIIDRVVDRVADEIIKKKAIVNEMPKKSEVANINKEWEKYFMELIDKAIAKRFK